MQSRKSYQNLRNERKPFPRSETSESQFIRWSLRNSPSKPKRRFKTELKKGLGTESIDFECLRCLLRKKCWKLTVRDHTKRDRFWRKMQRRKLNSRSTTSTRIKFITRSSSGRHLNLEFQKRKEGRWSCLNYQWLRSTVSPFQTTRKNRW